jgi:hypothetical protein
MVLVAFPAIHRSVTGWLEGYFSFLFAVSASCFEHFSRTHVLISRTTWSETATAVISFKIHVYISVDLFLLILLRKCCNCKFSHYSLNLNRYLVSDLRARHENH